MRIALYQPDIAQNVGSIARLSACMGVELHVIEPCGFIFDLKRLRAAALDYMEHVTLIRHASWEAFLQSEAGGARLVLLTTKAAQSYTAFAFAPDDTLLLGRESAGVPEEVHARAGARIFIPMKEGLRSLNIAQAAAIALSEGLRQTNAFPA